LRRDLHRLASTARAPQRDDDTKTQSGRRAIQLIESRAAERPEKNWANKWRTRTALDQESYWSAPP
jgi:hypothetical protein